jgi:hypothetical protein
MITWIRQLTLLPILQIGTALLLLLSPALLSFSVLTWVKRQQKQNPSCTTPIPD